MSEVTDIADCS